MSVTTMIFTLDEELNLPRCLASLAWCDDVIVVDSYSRDRTEAIARAAGARFFQHAFTGFGDQRNWAMASCSPKHEWILVLDADERVPAELAEELLLLARSSAPDVGAYRLRRRFYLWGKWLRHSSLYPTWIVRFVRRGGVRYVNRGHAETQEVTGRILPCRHDLIDENHKGLTSWFERQNVYSTAEAAHELASTLGVGATVRGLVSRHALERRRALKRVAGALPLRGCWYFLYSYVVRLGFLDGIGGFYFCRMRAMYQTQIEIKRFAARRSSGLDGLAT